MPVADGPIFQICWVVADIAAAEQYLTEHLSVPSWLRLPDVPFKPEDCTLRGEPAEYVIHVSLGYAGAQQLELIQPVSGHSLYSEHLEQHGPGLHHVAWVLDDYAEALAAAARIGVAIQQEGEMAGVMGYSYLDGGPLGTPIELMRLGPQIRAMFDTLVPAAYR